ncbi:hypothetical protein DEO72_LG6g1617 [Vigna unguiculata]|uniref:Uncharacterized protein n=1 Tax=Vigna unguiculata TaxID=3917 RepID=A0A4D6M7K3_VIGUN|nr:hypothetical protein DEO72_LG6g1617 [Vigna unguiculata]
MNYFEIWMFLEKVKSFGGDNGYGDCTDVSDGDDGGDGGGNGYGDCADVSDGGDGGGGKKKTYV